VAIEDPKSRRGDGWRRVAWVTVVLGTVDEGIALACVLAMAAMLMMAFHPGAAQTTAAVVLGTGAARSLLVAMVATVGVGTPRWRWALLAAALYALTALLCLGVPLADPGANGMWVLAPGAVVLALLTPWWRGRGG
jgi:hypothetical protein